MYENLKRLSEHPEIDISAQLECTKKAIKTTLDGMAKRGRPEPFSKEEVERMLLELFGTIESVIARNAHHMNGRDSFTISTTMMFIYGMIRASFKNPLYGMPEFADQVLAHLDEASKNMAVVEISGGQGEGSAGS